MRKKTMLLIESIALIFIGIIPKAEAIDWTTETVESSGDVGRYSSLALDKDGWPHISYLGIDDLKYAYEDSLGWHKTTVDATTPYYGDIWTSIVVDSLGYPHISYYDDYNNDLKLKW